MTDLPNCNDLLGILVASKKLVHGARAHEGECCFRRTKSGTFVLGLTAHDVRRTAHDPRWGMLVSAHEIRNIFCLRTAQVA